ncbi:hypothetical protein PDL71_17510 [Lacibacter sp. MH-610]|uniref:hypothetical protein n=1 Tax=Lacibacter sp. MH-610 TaxID=3020883 RepID=UPI003891D63D
MQNPFALLTVELMEAMLKEPKLFVRELYARGKRSATGDQTIPLLFTYYNKERDMERHRADYHYAQLKKDNYAFLYDSENPEHRERLLKAAAQPLPYQCYVNLLMKKWNPPLSLRRQLNTYMLNNFKDWNNHKTNIQLKDRFGKLFLIVSWEMNRVEIPLEEIENFTPCVMT